MGLHVLVKTFLLMIAVDTIIYKGFEVIADSAHERLLKIIGPPPECYTGCRLNDFDEAIASIDDYCYVCRNMHINYYECRNNCYANKIFESCLKKFALNEDQNRTIYDTRLRLIAACQCESWYMHAARKAIAAFQYARTLFQ